MGYLFTSRSKEQLVDSIKRDYPTMVEWSLVGNQLWGLYPVEVENDNAKKGDLVIILFLLSSSQGEWGYKVMDESAHPYYYACPKKFLKKAVVLNQGWRDEVMLHHAKKAKRTSMKFSVGQMLDLVNSSVKQVRVVSVSPLRGTDVDTGITYKIPKTMIKI